MDITPAFTPYTAEESLPTAPYQRARVTHERVYTDKRQVILSNTLLQEILDSDSQLSHIVTRYGETERCYGILLGMCIIIIGVLFMHLLYN